MQVIVRMRASTAIARVLTLITVYAVGVACVVVGASIFGFAAALIAWGVKYGWEMGWRLLGGW